MDVKQLGSKFSASLNKLNKQLNDTFHFVLGRLRQFKTLPREEQLSYVAVFLGAFLIFFSFILFIL